MNSSASWVIDETLSQTIVITKEKQQHSTQEAGQVDLCEAEASLVYMVSLKPT